MMIPVWLLSLPFTIKYPNLFGLIYSVPLFNFYKELKTYNTNPCIPSNSYSDPNYFTNITSDIPLLEIKRKEKIGLHIYGIGNFSPVRLFPDHLCYKIISDKDKNFTIDDYGNIAAKGKIGSTATVEITHKQDNKLKCYVLVEII